MEEEKQNLAESVPKTEPVVQKTGNSTQNTEKQTAEKKPKAEAKPKTIKPKVEPKPKAEKAISQTAAKQKGGKKIAVIMIRGQIALDKEIKDTFQMLNLHRKYNLVILEDNPVNEGMIHKVKDFTTFGEISEETIKLLNEKRPKGKNKYYSLPPPRGGLERRGSKKTFAQKGALGPRGDKINDLILRMI